MRNKLPDIPFGLSISAICELQRVIEAIDNGYYDYEESDLGRRFASMPLEAVAGWLHDVAEAYEEAQL